MGFGSVLGQRFALGVGHVEIDDRPNTEPNPMPTVTRGQEGEELQQKEPCASHRRVRDTFFFSRVLSVEVTD
jgi:hypothetical protein